MKAERIGIFGGTFDPPHMGHLITACEIYTQLHLHRLLWMLTPDPPHKQNQPITGLPDRIKMVQITLLNNPKFELSLVEAERPGPHYSVDTVRIVRERNPLAEVIFVMGGDSLQNLHTWSRSAEFIAACDQIGVMRRINHELNTIPNLPGLAEKLHFVDAPLLEISSSEIRRRACAGQSFRYYLPQEVYAYIMEKGLYQNEIPV